MDNDKNIEYVREKEQILDRSQYPEASVRKTNALSGIAALRYNSEKNYPKNIFTNNKKKSVENNYQDIIENDDELLSNEELMQSIQQLNLFSEMPESVFNLAAKIAGFINNIDKNFQSNLTLE